MEIVPRVEFFSRRVAESITKVPEDTAMISICDPSRPATIAQGWQSFIQLEFHDIDEPTEKYTLMNDYQARKLFAFIEKLEEDKIMDIYVHCEAGISRSGAVAKFIAEYLGVYFMDGYTVYNKHVYRMLHNVWHPPLWPLKEDPASMEEAMEIIDKMEQDAYNEAHRRT